MDGFCERGNELCAFIKCGEFVVKLYECRILKKASGPCSYRDKFFDQSNDPSIDLRNKSTIPVQ
jgi:hypothetical protein